MDQIDKLGSGNPVNLEDMPDSNESIFTPFF